MDKNLIVKWVYTFMLLGATIWWGYFCLNTITAAMTEPTQGNVLAVAGVSGLMGALLTWNALIIQHWFRKKTPE